MLFRSLMLMALLAVASSCQKGGDSQTAAAPQSETGLLAVAANDAARNADVVLKVRTAAGMGRINVIIGQINYDSSRMKLKTCQINAAVGEGTASGKQLLFLEQEPGSLRAIVTGSAEAVPADTELFTCSFAVAADAATGPAEIRVEAGVSDTDFVDHAFREAIRVTLREAA